MAEPSPERLDELAEGLAALLRGDSVLERARARVEVVDFEDHDDGLAVSVRVVVACEEDIREDTRGDGTYVWRANCLYTDETGRERNYDMARDMLLVAKEEQAEELCERSVRALWAESVTVGGTEYLIDDVEGDPEPVRFDDGKIACGLTVWLVEL